MMIYRRVALALLAGAVLFSCTDAMAKGVKVLRTATLVRSATAPAAAKGKAKYDQSASRTNFSVEGENLAALNGNSAQILINGVLQGTRPIALGRFKLELTNQRGGTVPAVSAGTKVDVKVNNALILAGNFN